MFTPHLRICLAAFLIDGACMTGILAIPFFVYGQLGGGVGMSGAFGASHAAGYMITCFAVSPFVSRARNGLHWALLGTLLYAGFLSFVPFFRNPWHCVTLSTLAFSSQALVWPALHSWVGAEPDPEARTRHMGWFNVSWSSGFAVFPLVAGPLIDMDYRLSFVLLFLLGMAGAVLIYSMPHEHAHFSGVTQDLLDARADHDRSSEIYLYCSWLATVVGNALVGMTRSVYPKRIDELVETGTLRLFFESVPADHLTAAAATKYSWLAAGLAGTTALTFVVAGATRGWRHSVAWLFGLQVAAAAAVWTLGATHSLAVMLLCFLVIGATFGLTFFSSVYYSVSDPDHKHRRATINEGAVGMGSCMGSLVFGYLAAEYGMALPFRWAPLIVGIALIVQWALIHHGHRRMLSS